MKSFGPQRIVTAILLLVIAGAAGSLLQGGDVSEEASADEVAEPLLGVTTPRAEFSSWDLLTEGQTNAFAELAEAAGARRDLESLVDADRVPLERTIFAPTDDAFATLNETLDLDNPLVQVELVGNHALDGARLELDDLAALDGQSVITMFGQSVEIDVVDGEVLLNERARVVSSSVAENGVVHVIDMVLVAPVGDCLGQAE